MKKKIYFLATAFMLMLASPSLMANEKAKPEMTTNQKVRFEEISRRVEDIKNMDKSELSRQERKDLRSELLNMKKEAKAMSGGVYLSVGAIIIIILLLILLL
jgi:hypothetical protein